MPSVDVEIASRRYAVACREGEEEHLRSVAALVDAKAEAATAALGSLSEVRQLLFASLLLADELKESRASGGGTGQTEPGPDVADSLERLAQRMENFCARLEGRPYTP